MQNAMITKTINHIKENVNIYEGVKIEMVTVHHENYIST